LFRGSTWFAALAFDAHEDICRTVYVNALLANLNARSKLRGESCSGSAIFIKTRQFRSPVIPSSSRKADPENETSIAPKVLIFSRQPVRLCWYRFAPAFDHRYQRSSGVTERESWCGRSRVLRLWLPRTLAELGNEPVWQNIHLDQRTPSLADYISKNLAEGSMGQPQCIDVSTAAYL
jgi:hypothetical protein